MCAVCVCVCGKINMRVLMRTALTAKTFISILSQSNEKVATRKGGKGKEIKPKETKRYETNAIDKAYLHKQRSSREHRTTTMMMMMMMILLATHKATLMTSSGQTGAGTGCYAHF